MGTLAFFNFLIILCVILSEFHDQMMKSVVADDTNEVVKNEKTTTKAKTKKFTTAPAKRTTIIGCTKMHSDLACVSAYDVLLLVSNLNNLLIDVQSNNNSNIAINFSPIFDVVKIGGCFKLKLNADYANIFDEPMQKFLTNDLIYGINPLVELDEKRKSCPNKNDANNLMAINYCAVGMSFSDQLSKNQNITDKIFQNSMKQLKSVKDRLDEKYKRLYKKLVASGYEKQLKNAVILKKIASRNYTIKLCKNQWPTTKQRKPLGASQQHGIIPLKSVPKILERQKTVTWDKYVTEYERSFETFKDVTNSANNFKDSKKDINNHNADYERRKTSFYMGFTKYSDQDTVPNGKRRGHPKTNNRAHGIGSNGLGPRRLKGDTRQLPDRFDWRTLGGVTSVFDQGNCSSCYAFSTVTVLEFLYFNKTKKLEALSKQQIIDCTSQFENLGCDGGYLDEVFDYLSVGKHGCELDSDYPYTGTEGKCKYNKSKTVLHIKGWKYASCDRYDTCHYNDEQEMQRVVATKGPISVGVYTNCPKFKNYIGGVYTDECCRGKTSADTNHAMTIVGYGKDYWGTEYWLLKNSYGSDWAENGYMRLKRGVNQCGVATEAIYATI